MSRKAARARGSQHDSNARARSLDVRENAVRTRETITGEHEALVADREQLVRGREDGLRPRAEAEEARAVREHLVAQLRAANEQLVLAKLHADVLLEHSFATDRAKDAFVAMLGHELRNPLSPVLFALDLMKLRGPDVFADERAVIERQVHHLVGLVDDLLDIARIMAGKIQLRRERVELAEVVDLAIELSDPLMRTKGHELTAAVSRSGLVVDVDPTRIAQVVANLLSNAAKYTPAHGAIRIDAERVGRAIRLRVSDNGNGISPTLLPHVFDLFTQEHQTLDRAEGGLGLGLAIVRTIVGMHGGTVTADSRGRGAGTAILIELPACDAPAATALAPVPRAVESLHRILVVDDNEDIAMLSARVLSKLGHEVRVARDGASALEAISEFTPDVALLDIGLPGMDGYELATHLQQRLGEHAVRLIAISGYGQPADRQRSLDAGFAMHLVKPVSVAALRDALA